MTLKHASRIGIIALLLAWIFDLLFWGQSPGVNYPIIVLAIVLAGLTLLRGEGYKPHPLSLVLILPVLFFASMVAFSMEPMTAHISILLSVILMACLAITLRSGNWLRLSLVDWIGNGFGLIFSSFSGGITLLQEGSKAKEVTETAVKSSGSRAGRSVLLRVLIGFLLALPVLFILGSLLAQADPAFSHLLNDLLQFLDLEYLAEYIYRAVYIAILGYLLAGVYLFSLTQSDKTAQQNGEYSPLKPFVGWIEAAVILALVDALFALFVGVQVRYFFGGQSNITVEGFTYAEYARRGFNELFWVVFLSLPLFLGISMVTRRETVRQRRVFSVLGVLLVGLLVVILVSAFQRLQLYEDAYGFTRMRTISHVFMLWVGALLLATAGLELVQRLRWFSTVLILSAIGFGLSLSLLNVDTFIARQNINRSLNGEELDAAYLVTLSDDAVPVLADYFNRETLPPSTKENLGGVLVCRLYLSELRLEADWRSYNFSRHNAESILNEMKPVIEQYRLTGSANQEPRVRLNGIVAGCFPD